MKDRHEYPTWITKKLKRKNQTDKKIDKTSICFIFRTLKYDFQFDCNLLFNGNFIGDYHLCILPLSVWGAISHSPY